MTPLNFEITDKGEVSFAILANSFGVGVYNLYLIWEDKASKKGEAFEKEAFILTDDATDTDSNGCYYFSTEVPCVAMDGLSAYDLYVLDGGGLTLQEWILSTVSSAKNELDRIAAEKERVSAESTRKTQEESRVINENTRILSENDRTAKEIARVSAENNREIQEKARKSSTDTALSNVNAAISNVNNLTELVNDMFTYGYLFSNILTSIEPPDFVGSIGKYFCITQIPGVYAWANSTEVNEGEIAFLVYSKDTETSTATWQKGSIKVTSPIGTAITELNADVEAIQGTLVDTTSTTTQDTTLAPAAMGSSPTSTGMYYWNTIFVGLSNVKKISFKALVGTTRIAIIDITTHAVITLLYTLTNTSEEAGSTKIVTLLDAVSLTASQAIAISGSFYYGSSTGDTMKDSGGGTTASYAAAYSVITQETVTVTTKGLTNSVAEIENRLVVVEDTVLEKEYIRLFSDYFSEKDSTKWSYVGIWNLSQGGVTTAGVGNTTYMQCTNVYHADNRFMRAKVLMQSNTVLKIPVIYGGINAGEGASCFTVDFYAKKLAIHSVGSGLDTQCTSTGYNSAYLESIDIPTEAIGSREYIIEIYKKGTTSTIRLLDTLTGTHLEISHTGWGAGRQNQNYAFYTESGTPPVFLSFEVYALYNPDVVFAGDSITEGVYVYDRAKRYAELFRSENPTKKVMISARGGDDIHGVVSKFTSEYNIYKPKIICVLIGANGGNTLTDLQILKAKCDAIGSTLILHYRTCQQNGNSHIAGNTMIAAVGVNGARFDKATALLNDPGDASTTVDGTNVRYNPSLYEDGGLHPNALGDQAMFNRLRIDTPELYF